jgi:hypothetical protein
VPSVAFAVEVHARLPLGPRSHGAFTYDAADFASCCGPASCHPLNEVSLLRFDADLSTDAGSRATRDPGVSPDGTLTRWLPCA